MSTRRLAPLALTAVVTLLAMPGTAFGGAFTALKPCYVSLPGTTPQTELVNLAGNGFAPNVPVHLQFDGQAVVTGAPVDAQGNLASVTAPAPFVSERDKPFTVTATQNGAPAASANTRVTALNVGIQPRRARPSTLVLFRGRGFTCDGKVYAHYRYKGNTRKTVSFTPKGACGKFSTRKRQIPVTRPGTGEWTVQFDQQKKYARTPSSVFVRLKIIVTRTVRASSSSAYLTTVRGF